LLTEEEFLAAESALLRRAEEGLASGQLRDDSAEHPPEADAEPGAGPAAS
jgi:hypothetical protein